MATQLTQLIGASYYIPGAVNTGVIVEGKDCLIIDTGLDRQSGKQILRCLEEEGLTPKVIINTHSHADHYGGNAIICKQTGAKVFASSLEKAVIENPYLEPFYLFSAAPVKDLSTRFLMAQMSPVNGVLEAGSFDSDGFHVEIINLPGHSPGQIGIVSGDGVCFTADAYFAQSILDKYGLPYCADITSALQTLTTLWQSDYSLYLPCHGEPEVKATETILKNVAVIERALEQILTILGNGEHTREEVLAAFMMQNNRELNPVQYVLNHGAITACLSHLHLISKVGYHFQDGKMLWKKSTGQTCSPVG